MSTTGPMYDQFGGVEPIVLSRGASVGGFATRVGTMAAAALSVGMGIAMGINRGRRVKLRLERPRAWRGSSRTKGFYRPKFKGSSAAKAGARMARKGLKRSDRFARRVKRVDAVAAGMVRDLVAAARAGETARMTYMASVEIGQHRSERVMAEVARRLGPNYWWRVPEASAAWTLAGPRNA